MSEADVRAELAAECEAAGPRLNLHRISPAAMLVEMLEIEDLQYVLNVLICKRVILLTRYQTSFPSEIPQSRLHT